MTKGAGRKGYRAVNRKAEQKLDYVVQKLVRCAGEEPGIPVVSEPLARVLSPRCCSEAGAVTVRYRSTSKLFAILYDLSYEFCVTGPKLSAHAVELAAGALKLAPGKGVAEDSSRTLPAALADNALIEARLRSLDVTRFDAVYDDDTHTWKISFSTMVGSATWNLLPPVMHLIEPTSDECLRTFELIRLLAVAFSAC